MNTPNPLIPQGSLQGSGTSNVRIAVATVLAIHVVFFGGLLLQGCKRDGAATAGAASETNAANSALSLPPIDSNSLFYPTSNSLPRESSAVAGTPVQPANLSPEAIVPPQTQTATAPSADPWKQLNTAAPIQPDGTGAAAGGKEYTVVRGDNYAKIAKKEGSTVSAIINANPGIEPSKIRPGMKLVVPKVAKTAVAAGAETNGQVGGKTYVVKPGDTLTKIARMHGVTISQLRAANNLRTSRVNVNQRLKIPAATNNTKAPTPETTASTVSTNPAF